MSDLVVIKEELPDTSDNENIKNLDILEAVYIKEEKDLSETELSIKKELLDYEETPMKTESFGDCISKYEQTLDLNIDCIAGDDIKSKIVDVKQYDEEIEVIPKKFSKSRNVLTCYNCNFKAVRRRVLIKHMIVHDRNIEDNLTKIMENNEYLYKCKFCNYKSINYSILKAHMDGHIDEKIFKCGLCNYSAKYKSALKIHLMMGHSNETPFICPYCDYKTVKSSELNRHIIIHSGEKPFKCKQCDYKTNRLYRLKVHNMRLHSNERPYRCSLCTYKATTGSDFKRHMCTHKDVKPYSCNECSYVTSRLYDLKMHTNKHTGKYLHQCKLCSHQTNYLSSFNKHMNTHFKKKIIAKH